MIAPARSGVTLRLVINQPLQRKFRLVSPSRIASGIVKAHKAPGKKAHALGGTAFANSHQGTHVDGKPAHSLLKHRAQEFAVEGKRAQEFCAQTVKRIIAAVIVLFEPSGKSTDGLIDLILHKPSLAFNPQPLTNRCHHIFPFRSCDQLSARNPPELAHRSTAPARSGRSDHYCRSLPFERDPEPHRCCPP